MINTTSDPAMLLFGEGKRMLPGSHGFSGSLLREIDALLRHQDVRLDSVTAVAVAVGPGPFTALRIGVAAANALAWTKSIPVIEVDSDIAATQENFQEAVADACRNGRFVKSAKPVYGQPPSITPQPTALGSDK